MSKDSPDEYLLSKLIEAAPDAMIVVNKSGQIIFANRQMERLFGYSRDEIISQDIEVLLPERFRMQHKLDRTRYSEAPTLRSMAAGRELLGKTQDGAEIAVDIMLSPLRDRSELFIIATVRDVSERRRLEQKLATSEAMFHSLFDQAPDAIIAVDKQGRIVQANSRVRDFFGYEPSELLQQTIEILIPERLRARHITQRQGYEKNATLRSMGAGLELYAKRKDQSEFPVDIMLNPIQMPGYEVTISIIRDVTDRKRIEGELKERAVQLVRSNQELEQFAYIASHDLQEPLRAIAASCQILQKKLVGKLDEDTNEYFGFAIDGARRMQALISDLLSYARVGKGREFEAVRTDLVLDRVLDNLQPQIVETQAVISHSELPLVRGDFSQLVQVFQNLLSNAMKFRGSDTVKIHISAQEGELDWIFTIHDNGIGIQEKYMEKIFVIFQRLHRREEYPGTGIGLAICKKIVERHGGKIWLESKIGAGTTFFFTLRKETFSNGNS